MDLLIISQDADAVDKICLLASHHRHINRILITRTLSAGLKKLRNEKPEIVLISLSPRRTPANLLGKLHAIRHGSFIVTLVQSRESAVGSMQAGSADYIFLPVEPAEVEKVLDHMAARFYSRLWDDGSFDRRYERLQQQELKAVKVEKVLFTMIATDNRPEELYARLCAIAPEYAYLTKCRVGIIAAEHLPVDARSLGDGVTSASLTMLLGSMMQERRAGVAVSGVRSAGEFSLFFLGDSDLVEEKCVEMMEALRQQTGLHLHVGLGPALSFPWEVKASADEARRLAKSYNLLKEEGFVHSGADCPSREAIGAITLLSREIYTALRSGNGEHIRQSAEKISDALVKRDFLCLSQLEKAILIYRGMRTGWIELSMQENETLALEPMPPFQFRTPFDAYGVFRASMLQESFYSDFLALSSYLLRHSEKGSIKNTLLQSVDEYIRQNYSQPISQRQVATYFSMNPSYLSRIFKQEKGVGMSDYINTLRIENAKRLMRGSKLLLQEIAEIVGFRDSKYFTRVFKQREGISPRDYRAGRRPESKNNLPNP